MPTQYNSHCEHLWYSDTLSWRNAILPMKFKCILYTPSLPNTVLHFVTSTSIWYHYRHDTCWLRSWSKFDFDQEFDYMCIVRKLFSGLALQGLKFCKLVIKDLERALIFRCWMFTFWGFREFEFLILSVFRLFYLEIELLISLSLLAFQKRRICM